MEKLSLQWGYMALPCLTIGGLGYVLIDSLDYDPSKPVTTLSELHAVLETFNFEESRLNEWQAPILAGLGYLGLIFFLQWLVGRAVARSVRVESMRGQAFDSPPPPPYTHRRHGVSKVSANYEAICSVQCWHNLWLCAWSLVMCVGCSWSCWERYKAEGNWEWVFCETPSDEPASGALYFWAFMYYLSKYYELIDTYLQVLKSGTVHSPWLHLYHHSVVGVMAWLWLEQRQSLMFAGLIFNTFVHVPMYLYYGQTSMLAGAAAKTARAKGLKEPPKYRKPWWGKYITLLQIVQFVSSLVLLSVTLFGYVFASAGANAQEQQCSGLEALAFNTIFNVTLLGQFVDLYGKKTGGKKEKTKKQKQKKKGD